MFKHNSVSITFTSSNFSPFLADAKLLATLLNDAPYLQAISERLNRTLAGVGNYRAVANNYGLDCYSISLLLEENDRGPTTALIEWLAAARPELTVQEFAAVVREKAKREDAAALLKAYMDDPNDSNRLKGVTETGKQLKSRNNIMYRIMDT